MTRRQVFDIPPIHLHVVEHQLITRRWGCGTTAGGQAPNLAGAPVQYGPVATAIMLCLFHGQSLIRHVAPIGQETDPATKVDQENLAIRRWHGVVATVLVAAAGC